MLGLSVNTDAIAQNYMQWIATFTTTLMQMQAGFAIGWGSPNVARFMKNDSSIHLMPEEITWVASSKELAGVPAAVLGPLCVQFFGPKNTGLISLVIYALSWLCILLATNFTWLVIGRLLVGFAAVVNYICFPIYLSEIANPELRGTFIALSASCGIPGIVIALILETYLPVRFSTPVYLIHSFVGIALFAFVLPETPYFLAGSNKTVAAKESIERYFPQVKPEEKLTEIQNFVKSEADGKSVINKITSIFSTAHTRKLIYLIVVMSSLIQCSGLTNIQRYMQNIFERANSYVVDPKNAPIYINATCFITKILMCRLIDTLGRKFIFLLASVLVTVTLGTLGTYFYVMEYIRHLEYLQWVPVICIMVFRTGFSLGFTTGLYVILGELCPPNAKNFANCLSYLCQSFLGFVLTKVHLLVSDYYGDEYLFWFHALSALAVIPIVIFVMPETKGKKLEDI